MKLTPHRGAFIRSSSRKEANDLLVVFEVLCGVAARLATVNIKQGDNQNRFKAAEQAINGVAEWRGRQWFRRTRTFLPNDAEYLRQCGIGTHHAAGPHLYVSYPISRPTVKEGHCGGVKEYQDVAATILAGDTKRAESHMRRHIRKTGERMGKLPDSAFAAEEKP